MMGQPGRYLLYFIQAVSLVKQNLIAALDNRYLDWRYRPTDCKDTKAQSLRKSSRHLRHLLVMGNAWIGRSHIDMEDSNWLGINEYYGSIRDRIAHSFGTSRSCSFDWLTLARTKPKNEGVVHQYSLYSNPQRQHKHPDTTVIGMFADVADDVYWSGFLNAC